MENLQSEIIFVGKLFGIISVIGLHFFYVIKPLAVFNERQKRNRKDIDKLEIMCEEFSIVKTEHDMNFCPKQTRRSKK